jgi:hypothetical protein
VTRGSGRQTAVLGFRCAGRRDGKTHCSTDCVVSSIRGQPGAVVFATESLRSPDALFGQISRQATGRWYLLSHGGATTESTERLGCRARPTTEFLSSQGWDALSFPGPALSVLLLRPMQRSRFRTLPTCFAGAQRGVMYSLVRDGFLSIRQTPSPPGFKARRFGSRMGGRTSGPIDEDRAFRPLCSGFEVCVPMVLPLTRWRVTATWLAQ